MKIGVWLSQGWSLKEGGGFSYYDMLIDAINKHQFNGVDIAFVTFVKKTTLLQKENICIPLSKYFLFKLFKIMSIFIPQKMLSKYIVFYEMFICDYLVKKGVSVLFFPIQGSATLTNLPFISNNWDIGHRATFAFPELSKDTIFEERDNWYLKLIQRALLVFCESETGRKELIRYTNIADERVKVVPTFAGKAILSEIKNEDQEKILQKFSLIKNKYFFYPAQFWAHKNHYGLLCAFKSLTKKYKSYKLILTGSDKGNLPYVKMLVDCFDLQEKVIFGGFVTNEEIATFYRNATALVMATFFGPTNMPLLEANALGCPVLCSDIEGHREMLFDAALYFSPKNHTEIASCMEKILQDEIRESLLLKAKDVLNHSKFNITNAICAIDKHFQELEKIRSCWE